MNCIASAALALLTVTLFGITPASAETEGFTRDDMRSLRTRALESDQFRHAMLSGESRRVFDAIAGVVGPELAREVVVTTGDAATAFASPPHYGNVGALSTSFTITIDLGFILEGLDDETGEATTANIYCLAEDAALDSWTCTDNEVDIFGNGQIRGRNH